jgi:hypothetical protein
MFQETRSSNQEIVSGENLKAGGNMRAAPALGILLVLAFLGVGITYTLSGGDEAEVTFNKAAPAPAPAQNTQPQLASVAPAPIVPLREPATVDPGAEWRGSVPAGTRVRVSNGTGRPLMAGRFAKYFTAHGLSVQLIRNANTFDYPRTVIFYNPDQRDNAFALAAVLPFPVRMAEASVGRGEIEFVLGDDLIAIDETLRSAA